MNEPTVHALFRPDFESWGTTRLCCGRDVLDSRGKTRHAVSIMVPDNDELVTCGNCKAALTTEKWQTVPDVESDALDRMKEERDGAPD